MFFVCVGVFQVRVSIDVDDDLTLVSRDVGENGLVRVPRGSGVPFNIKLRPRSVARALLTPRATMMS